MSEAKPITPEDLARLDALERRVQAAHADATTPFDEAIALLGQFSRARLDAWPGIRARIAEMDKLIADLDRVIAQMKARILEQKIAVDADVAALKHYPERIAQQAQRIQTLADALAAESAKRLEDKQRIKELGREIERWRKIAGERGKAAQGLLHPTPFDEYDPNDDI